MILHNFIPDIIRYQEYVGNVPDIAQITHGIRNIFADIRNVSTAFFCVELYRGKVNNDLSCLKVHAKVFYYIDSSIGFEEEYGSEYA